MKCSIIYNSGNGKNGEYDKALSIIKHVSRKFSILFLIDIKSYKKNPLSLIKLLNKAKKSDVVFIVLAKNGAYLGGLFLQFFLNRTKTKIYYFMVGLGPLKTILDKKHYSDIEVSSFFQNKDKWFIDNSMICKVLRRYNRIFIETETLKETYDYTFNLSNTILFYNFRLDSVRTVKAPYIHNNQDGVLHLVYFARLTKEKGLFDLIKACNLLSEQTQSKFKIDVFGSNNENYNTNELFPKCMEYKGDFFGDNITLLSRYDYLIFPSHYEGMPGTIIESLISGLPCLSSRFTFVHDILREGKDSFLFDCGSVKQISDLLLDIVLSIKRLHDGKQEAFSNGGRFLSNRVTCILDEALQKDFNVE